MRRTVAAMMAMGVAVCGVAALGHPPTETTSEKAVQKTSTPEPESRIVRVDKWKLFRSSGEELYAELCASCHGAESVGIPQAAGSEAITGPPLDRLKQAGVPREHWTYVILAPYEDPHHWTADGAESMPCWSRIFRHATGSDAAAMMVSAKLADYLDAIQQ